VRIDAEAFRLQPALGIAQLVEQVEHFAFQAFQMLQRDVQEVGRTASRVKHLDLAQTVMELVQLLACFGELGRVRQE